MAHSNDLSYRAVLVSESKSEPQTAPPAPTVPIRVSQPVLPAVDPFSYQVVPLEESRSKSNPQPDTAQLPVPNRRPLIAIPVPDAPVHDSYGDVQRREIIRLRKPRKRRWRLERHGVECLGYLFHEWRYIGLLVGGLGLATAVGSAIFLLLAGAEAEGMVFLLLWAGLPLYAVCFIAGFWHGVLASGLAGEAGAVRWPGLNLPSILEGCSRSLWCVLAGPIIPLAAGFYFWLTAGDLQALDWLILAELIFVAAAYWLFAFLAVVDKGSVLKGTPGQILDTVRQLGWHAPLAALLIFSWVLIHGLWALDAAKELHRFVGSGWISLWFCSMSAVFWMTCLLRWLGVRLFLNRTGEREESSATLWTPQQPLLSR